MTDSTTDPSDKFVEYAQGQMGAIEDLLKGLPGIRGYIDKELRRDADKRLRVMIANQLDGDKRRLLELQNQLMRSGGLAGLDDVDRVITKLQTLSDRIRTASYGYAGFFDPARVREDELRALHQFDVAMAARMGEIDEEISALGAVIGGGDGPTADAIAQLANTVNELTALYDKRNDALLSPDLLLGAGYAPSVDTRLLEAADEAAASASDDDAIEMADPDL
jgi:hypothetical protein